MKAHPDAGAAWPSTDDAGTDRLLELLQEGKLTLRGLLPWSSNYTFLGQISKGGERVHVVYKPVRGERPLWDFPRGTLAKRETAAYVLSRALRWDLVPPTVLRGGPHGLGSVQLFVNVDQDAHFFTFHDDPAMRSALQALALFDVIANNADRKGGHCIRLGEDRIMAIDQGLCFNVESKLRTVIWDFAGEPVPIHLTADLERLDSDLRDAGSSVLAQLRLLLSPGEIRALRFRLAGLLATGCFPDPPEDRPAYPWPPV
jgi:uncharacterized repeat protein (TIGR03843 family)